jgi:hypothetical protein
MTPVKQWFGRKRFGWGWSPRSVEGWLIVGVGAAVILGIAR